MNEERDRFLTEFMRACWHDYDPDKPINTYSLEAYICNKCKGFILGNNDFSIEEDFMRLWKWAKAQEYLKDLISQFDEAGFKDPAGGRANRDRLADTLYEFIAARKESNG
jgi:hypothetical protein